MLSFLPSSMRHASPPVKARQDDPTVRRFMVVDDESRRSSIGEASSHGLSSSLVALLIVLSGTPLACFAAEGTTPGVIGGGQTAANAPSTMLPNPSASASRLLVTPPSSVRTSRQIRQQLEEQIMLQDEKVNECREMGQEWEQCFFFGMGGIAAAPFSSNTALPPSPPMTNNPSFSSSSTPPLPFPSRSSVPTW